MAHKKGVGSSRNGRDSNPQMLGVKRFGGQFVTAGRILSGSAGPASSGHQRGPGCGPHVFAKARLREVQRKGDDKYISIAQQQTA